MFKRIDHVEITPSDLERSLAFYIDTIGFVLKERIPIEHGPVSEVVFLTLGDTMLELVSMKNPTPAGNDPARVGYRAMALEVDDMDTAVAELAAKGVPITWGPMALGPSKRAEIQDPDGLTIELRQW